MPLRLILLLMTYLLPLTQLVLGLKFSASAKQEAASLPEGNKTAHKVHEAKGLLAKGWRDGSIGAVITATVAMLLVFYLTDNLKTAAIAAVFLIFTESLVFILPYFGLRRFFAAEDGEKNRDDKEE